MRSHCILRRCAPAACLRQEYYFRVTAHDARVAPHATVHVDGHAQALASLYSQLGKSELLLSVVGASRPRWRILDRPVLIQCGVADDAALVDCFIGSSELLPFPCPPKAFDL